MKLLIFILMGVFFTSCAHKAQNIEELNDYSFKHNQEIIDYVCNMIDEHKDYNKAQKKQLKTILTSSLNENHNLKVKESKTAQLFLDSLIAEKYSEKRVASIKKDMHKIYEDKEKLFVKTAKEIKSIVGVKPKNHALTEEIVPFMR